MITIAEEIAVPNSPERVWAVVSSPSDVVSCIPGAELGAPHDDGSFDGVLVVRFAAIRVRFAARVSLELEESAYEGRLSARGRDGQGATRFSGHATFQVAEGEEPGSARMTIRGEVNLTGKLASLIESGAGVVVARMTKEFSAQLIERCAEPAAQPTAGPAAEPAPPAGAPMPVRRPSRFRAWWARLLHRAVRTHHPREEAGHGEAQ